MADRPLLEPLPADLPEDWTSGQIVAPSGADAGLSEQHGYNYLMAQVNAAQRAANAINERLADGDIENTITVDGGGHMEVEEALGGPPYQITVTEEADAPITAEDVGAVPLPDNPQKGQALIFDGSQWIPGDVTTELPVASAAVLGGVKVGESLKIDKGVLDARYIRSGTASGNFSASETTKEIFFYQLIGDIRPLTTFSIYTKNRSAVETEFKWEIVDSVGGSSVLHQQTIHPNSGISHTFAAAQYTTAGRLSILGGTSGVGDRLRLSSSAGVGTYLVTVVGFGPITFE